MRRNTRADDTRERAGCAGRAAASGAAGIAAVPALPPVPASAACFLLLFSASPRVRRACSHRAPPLLSPPPKRRRLAQALRAHPAAPATVASGVTARHGGVSGRPGGVADRVGAACVHYLRPTVECELNVRARRVCRAGGPARAMLTRYRPLSCPQHHPPITVAGRELGGFDFGNMRRCVGWCAAREPPSQPLLRAATAVHCARPRRRAIRGCRDSCFFSACCWPHWWMRSGGMCAARAIALTLNRVPCCVHFAPPRPAATSPS